MPTTTGWRENVKSILQTNPAYKALIPPAHRASAALSAAADAPPDGEIKKYYATALNGNVIFVTTAKDEASLNPAAKDVFQKAVVLMGAITTALGDKASLYDFDIYNTVISKSGYFMPLDLQDSNFHADSTTVTLDLAIIAEVVGMAAAPEAAAALQGVVQSLGGKLTVAVDNKQMTKKVAKMVLWLEEIMGVPLVMVQIYYVMAGETQTLVSTPCVKVATQAVDFKYHLQGYMFVDPAWIAKFTPNFTQTAEYTALIKTLSGLIPAQAPAPAPAPAA